jgi:ubiquinone/menaquinone biosynthesis C-methylase UbiE
MSEGHSYGNGVSGFDQTFGLLMRQFVPTLIRIAKLTPGQRVLDIATGTGIAAEAALDAVGPSGHVTAADDTPLMLAEARHRLGASPNVSFAVERAGSLTFPDASFNAVLCSMALMIFPDRGHALAEFHRVLRRGGQLVVSINTRPERSLTGLVRMAVARHVPSMTAAMTHHYSLSDAARLRVLLETAKFQSVAVVMEPGHSSSPPLTPISSRSNRAGDHGGHNMSRSRPRNATSSNRTFDNGWKVQRRRTAQ